METRVCTQAHTQAHTRIHTHARTHARTHTHTPLSFLQAGCPSCRPTNSVKALKPNRQQMETHTHTHTHPFNGPLSGTTRVSRYQKGKPNWTADGNNENKSRSEKFATYRRNNLCAVVNSSRELIKCRLCFRQTQVIHHVIKSRKSL